MKVKLFKTREIDFDNSTLEILTDGITDWSEITPEEYKALKDNLWRLNKKYHEQHVLVEDVSDKLPEKIEQILKLLEIQCKKEKRANKDYELKQKVQAEKKKLKQIEKAKKLLKESGEL